ncbi:hypothetical protein PR048_010362 [Dryococelus australis]|uniref:DDE-1 domain-containing protein n=1 Tax=Dryococelus australis TaxID=614101 RepID=A0ABQ9I2H9_9NEOP|nr:hypothetical protein PR048_010362 [Dryococelus australis]
MSNRSLWGHQIIHCVSCGRGRSIVVAFCRKGNNIFELLHLRGNQKLCFGTNQRHEQGRCNNIFEMFENLSNENNLFGDPARIHDADKTRLQLNNRKTRDCDYTYICYRNWWFPTAICDFKGKNIKQEFRDDLPPGSVVFMSDSGYITIELFRRFLEYFVMHKPQGEKTNILVLDGHSAHVSDPDILQFAVGNNIIMNSIPSHTSYYIQPLDRSFFRSLKMHYYGPCNSWIKQNPTRSITKLQYGMLFSQAWDKASSVENGVSGFRAYRLVPFNPGAIPESAFSPSDDSSPDDSFSEDLHRKKDINSLLQQLCPTPRILQKSSSRCQKAAILACIVLGSLVMTVMVKCGCVV